MGLLRAKSIQYVTLCILSLALWANATPIALAECATDTTSYRTSDADYSASACFSSECHLALHNRGAIPSPTKTGPDKFCGKYWVKRELFNNPFSFLRNKIGNRILARNSALMSACLSDSASALSGWSTFSIKRNDKAAVERPLFLLASRPTAHARITLENQYILPGHRHSNSNRAPPSR